VKLQSSWVHNIAAVPRRWGQPDFAPYPDSNHLPWQPICQSGLPQTLSPDRTWAASFVTNLLPCFTHA